MLNHAVRVVTEGMRRAGSWDEVWSALVLGTASWWEGFAVTTATGVGLFSHGRRTGVGVTFHTEKYRFDVATDDPSSLPVEDQEILVQEINLAAERLGDFGAVPVSNETAAAMFLGVMDLTKARVAFFDRQMRYVHVNTSLAAWHGIMQAEHLGMTMREVLGELAGAVEPLVNDVFAGVTGYRHAFFTGALPGRPTQTMQGSYFPVRVGGEVVLCGAVVRVHQPERAHDEAVRAAFAKVKASAVASDELDDLEKALTASGLTGAACNAHDAAMRAAMGPHAAGLTARVLRWQLRNGPSRVAVCPAVIEAVVSEGLQFTAHAGVGHIRSLAMGNDLVFVISSTSNVPAGTCLASTAALVGAGGSVQADGDIIIRLPLAE